MLTELGKRIDLNTDLFNKELPNIKKTLSKINSIFEIKSTLKAMNKRLYDTEEHIRIADIKKDFKNEYNISDLSHNNKLGNIHIIRVP